MNDSARDIPAHHKRLENITREAVERINHIFSCSKPGPVTEYGKFLAVEIEENCPDSREKSLALTKVEEAVMWANASIARNSKTDKQE